MLVNPAFKLIGKNEIQVRRRGFTMAAGNTRKGSEEHKTSGFTLIEIAIVLVVIGLLLSGGLVALAPVVRNAQVTTTENKLDKIEDALVLYAIQNNCLPCPADSSDAGAQAGIHQTGAGANSATCAGGGSNACFPGATPANGVRNIVPWITLGLSQADVTDEWGTYISYHVSSQDFTGTNCDDFSNTAVASSSGTGGFTRTGTTFPIGCLDVSDADPGGVSAITTAAAYVLISHGPDTSGGRAAQSDAARTNPRGAGNTVQEQNDDGTCDSSGTVCHQDDAIDVDGNNYFDDIVRWKTGPVLVYDCGEAACGSP